METSTKVVYVMYLEVERLKSVVQRVVSTDPVTVYKIEIQKQKRNNKPPPSGEEKGYKHK